VGIDSLESIHGLLKSLKIRHADELVFPRVQAFLSESAHYIHFLPTVTPGQWDS
jgi:hypothetical protein